MSSTSPGVREKENNPPRAKLTNEARRLAAAQQCTAAKAYTTDLQKAWKTIDNVMEDIAGSHHKSICCVQHALHMGKGGLTRPKRSKTSAWNAFVCKVSIEQSADVPSGREALANYVRQNCEEYKKLTAEEKEALVEDLEVHKSTTKTARRISNRSKVNDISHTLSCIEDKLQNLRSRTGCESLLFIVRGSTDVAVQGSAFATSGVHDFLTGTMRIDGQDFMSKLESHAIQGLKGSAKTHKDRVSEIHSSIWRIMNQKLVDAIHESSAEMKWKHYWRDIIKRHHVMIKGWPSNVPFTNLSDVSSALPNLENLLRKWECGTTFWKSISDDEFARLDRERDLAIKQGKIPAVGPRQERSDKGKKRAHADTMVSNDLNKRPCSGNQNPDNGHTAADNEIAVNPNGTLLESSFIQLPAPLVIANANFFLQAEESQTIEHTAPSDFALALPVTVARSQLDEFPFISDDILCSLFQAAVDQLGCPSLLDPALVPTTSTRFDDEALFGTADDAFVSPVLDPSMVSLGLTDSSSGGLFDDLEFVRYDM